MRDTVITDIARAIAAMSSASFHLQITEAYKDADMQDLWEFFDQLTDETDAFARALQALSA